MGNRLLRGKFNRPPNRFGMNKRYAPLEHFAPPTVQHVSDMELIEKHPGEKLVEVGLIRDGVVHGQGRGFKEHWRLRGMLGDADPYQKQMTDTYGFITSTGRFVDREQAVPIAVEAGQIDRQWLNVGRELLSSDVW